jgi:plastocyanin
MNSSMGVRGLVLAILVLAAVVAAPALSVAQEAGTTTTATEPGPIQGPAEPSAPADSADPAVDSGQSQQAEATAAPEPAGVTTRGSNGARAAASATVRMGDFFFSPATVSIAVGDTVTWRNNGQEPHNATADDGSFKTADLNGGQSGSHTFNAAGSFSYICTIHPNMHGTVRVLTASGGGGGGGGGSGASRGSEASAVASPDAAGSGSSLAATGMEALGLAAIGLALVTGGLALRRRHTPSFFRLPPF